MDFEIYIMILLVLVVVAFIVLIITPTLSPDRERIYRDFDMLTINVKYIRDIKPIDIIDVGDWIDLRSGIDLELEPFQYYSIPLGVAMQLPGGYSAIIAPRSSTFLKWGIIQTNSIGIIDNSYCGDGDEWKIPVLAMRKTKIHKNDRICQFRLVPCGDELELVKVKSLGNANRGGFGSTGYK